MKKIILVFPGQGSQFIGMGKNFDNEILKRSYKKADEILGFELSKICQEGPMEQLKLTANTQPAILAHSYASLQVVQNLLEKHQQKADTVLGHSVGEYGALVAAKVLTFEDAVKAVHHRGKYMQDAVPVGEGKMFAVLRLKAGEVSKICSKVGHSDCKVVPANFNDPEQTVISGHTLACEEAVKEIKNIPNSRARVVELPVSAPFHSPLMSPARKKLAIDFEKLTFKANEISYIANINYQLYKPGTNPEEIKDNLIKQVDGSVHWLQSIQKFDPKESLFIEVGPGKILKGLIKKIHPEATVFCSDEPKDMELLETELTNKNLN